MGRYSLPGLTIASLKKHVALTPLFFLSALCTVTGLGYLARIGLNHPEISWSPTSNSQPWNKLDQTYKYRFLNMTNSNPYFRPEYRFWGSSVSSLRKHYALTPLLFISAVGTIFSFAALARTALYNPEITFAHTSNPEPWNKTAPKTQYKFLNPRLDYSKLDIPADRPSF